MAITLALIALLSGEENITEDWQKSDDLPANKDNDRHDNTSEKRAELGRKREDERAVWWKALDFANGRYLYRQYDKMRRAFSSGGSSREKVL